MWWDKSIKIRNKKKLIVDKQIKIVVKEYLK